MLSLIGGLLKGRSRQPREEAEDAKSGDPFADIKVDVYYVQGESSREILQESTAMLLEEELVFVGCKPEEEGALIEVLDLLAGNPSSSSSSSSSSSRGAAATGKQGEIIIDLLRIRNFRQHQNDMAQFSIDIEGGVIELGLVFNSSKEASLFSRCCLSRVCASFAARMSICCQLLHYDRLAAEWIEAAAAATAEIRERGDCDDAYVLVYSSSSNNSSSSSSSRGSGKGDADAADNSSGSSSTSAAAAADDDDDTPLGSSSSAAAAAATQTTAAAASTAAAAAAASIPLCYIRVSHDEFVFAAPQQQELQWWGVSPDGERRLYKISFASPAAVAAAAAAAGITLPPSAADTAADTSSSTAAAAGAADDDKNSDDESAAAAATAAADPQQQQLQQLQQQQQQEGSKFLQLYALTLAEVSSKCRFTLDIEIEKQIGYLGEFDTKPAEDEVEGMHIEEADSDPSDDEEQFPIVARDPTRHLLKSSPDCMVNEMLEAGKERVLVFRVGGGDDTLQCKRDMRVLKFDEYGKSSVVATIDGSKLNLEGRSAAPGGALLNYCEERVVLLPEGEGDGSSSALLFNLETEQIIQTINSDLKIKNVLPMSSAAKGTAECRFLGFNDKDFFCLDPRVKGLSARKQTYSYTQNQSFTCGATDGEGHLVLGSGKGVLRLYDGKGKNDNNYKRAKTQLNAYRDPIKHVAVTKDGSWILATCARYLLLYPVRLEGSSRTGFTSPLGGLKPKPLLLQLTLQDINKFNLQSCLFKSAVFDQEEQHIVTSTNNLVIIWDFVAVKNGKTDAYQIRRISDYIKDLTFMQMGEKEAVLMVTPSSITTRGVRRAYKDCESGDEA